MSRNIVFEGWLTKSPPSNRIWRGKWRKRWFALRQSGELPGQYFLDYYSQKNCRRLKGTINLDLCEQVDAGLHMNTHGSGSLDPSLRGSVFSVCTQSRTYHLKAECEAEMERWVDAICRVCGLRATEDTALVRYQNSSAVLDGTPDGTGPYIPISECITGTRVPQRAFTFDPRNIVTSSQFNRSSPTQLYMSQQQMYNRGNNPEFSGNESNLSEDESKSWNNSQSNIGDWSVTKTFTKLAINPNRNAMSDSEGPPVPPRPPKTFAMSRYLSYRDTFHAPKPEERAANDNVPGQTPWLRLQNRRSNTASGPSTPGKLNIHGHSLMSSLRYMDDDDDLMQVNLPTQQYYNLPSMPPVVDRALKPRPFSHNIGHFNPQMLPAHGSHTKVDIRPDALQYLDLDLPMINPVAAKKEESPKKKTDIPHGRSLPTVDADSAYKTVDFLKTEAFNITKQYAEASRNTQI